MRTIPSIRGPVPAAVALAGALLLNVFPAFAEEVPPRLGPDFQVNTFTLGDQVEPGVARFPDGGFVVVWNDMTNSRVKARRYLASGAPAGDEIKVSEPGFLFSPPHVAARPDGGFTVVWGGFHDVLLRRFDRAGLPLGNAAVVNGPEADSNRQPDVAADSHGNLAVVWYRDGFFDDLVLLRRFDAAGNPLGGPVQVNSFTSRRPSGPHVAVNGSGSLLVTWREEIGSHLLVRRFDGPVGAWSNELRVAAPFGGHPVGSAPLLYPDGEGAVVFGDLATTSFGVFAQRLDAAGKPLGETIPVGDEYSSLTPFDEPDAAIDGAGNAFVVWTHFNDPEVPRIFGRLFNRSWQPQGDAFPVSGDPLRLSSDDLEPAVAADAFGGFSVVWSNGRLPFFFPILLPPQVLNGRDGSLFGVFGQVFGDPDCAAGSDVLCLGEGNRFRVRVNWKVPAGDTGAGHARRLTADTGALWFFQESNLELMIKILDGRAINGHFWVFYGALSNVEYTLTVTDTATGQEKTYTNPVGQLASRADTAAFKEEPPASPPAAAGPALSDPSACGAGGTDTALCLGSGRFRVEVTFVDPTPRTAGPAHAVDLTADTGAFWFFQASNLELMLKILDGRAINGHFWVFYGALSDVQYTIKVTDTATGEERTYSNQRGRLASRADTGAFPVEH